MIFSEMSSLLHDGDLAIPSDIFHNSLIFNAMTKREVLKKTEEYVNHALSGEGTGHDWWHVLRVRNTARYIAKGEKADLFVVELTALLHDIADHKFHGGDSSIGPRIAHDWLKKLGVAHEVISHVTDIIANMSYHKSLDGAPAFTSKELKIVQDADRLDAMGAIGIARAFAYGGHKGRELYNPNVKPAKYKSSGEYKKHPAGTTINHFYEKLLLLKERMNTRTGKRLARARHAFLEKYLFQFYAEWGGEN